RCVARPVRRDLPGEDVRAAVRRLLSHRGCGAVPAGPGRHARDEERTTLTEGATSMTRSTLGWSGAIVIGLSLSAALVAQGRGTGRAAAPAVPAPPPGSPGIYKTNADLMSVLKNATEASPDMSTSAVANTDQYRINIVRRGKGAGAIAHAGNTELHYIVDGAATFVTGGTILR